MPTRQMKTKDCGILLTMLIKLTKRFILLTTPNQSDLKIFFVDYPNQAGWRSKAKKHLLF